MSKNKKIAGYIKLQVAAGKANPSPPIGPALGQRGVNIMEFCNQFNAKTKAMEPGSPIPVVITVYADKSFTFITRTPPVSYFLKKFGNIAKGSAEARKGPHIGKITLSKVKEIAKLKLADMNAYDEDAAISMIRGSAESMGLQVVEG